jgi:cytidylate kinase
MLWETVCNPKLDFPLLRFCDILLIADQFHENDLAGDFRVADCREPSRRRFVCRSAKPNSARRRIMKIQISDNIIRYYLRSAYFINGHSYAGKSTMVKMLAERYDMVFCGENYNDVFPHGELSRWKQPALAYFDTMSGWEEWLNMTPEEHWKWTSACSQECVEIEIAELIKLSARGKKIIVDTNIPPDILRDVSDYSRVVIMLCDPADISVMRFFDRDDPDKKFMMEKIKLCKDSEATLANFNSWQAYQPPNDIDWAHTGFFSYTRTDFETDTREGVLAVLAKHFGLG